MKKKGEGAITFSWSLLPRNFFTLFPKMNVVLMHYRRHMPFVALITIKNAHVLGVRTAKSKPPVHCRNYANAIV